MPIATRITVIDEETRPGEYGWGCRLAIIDHPELGRLLASQAFGGTQDIEGGAHRWRHGMAVCIPESITSLDGVSWMQALVEYGPPVIDGLALANIAEAAGL